MGEYLGLIKKSWVGAWNHRTFRMNFLLGVVLLTLVMVATSFFFNYIQDSPPGITWNDWVLKMLPSMDVSVYIVALMGSAATLFAVRGLTDPDILLTFLFAIILELVARMITITLTGFMPPHGLVILKDPMGSMLYQYRFISRDLFFSGHTAIITLIFLCSTKKFDKAYSLLAILCLGFLLLIQHVHYTIDVVSAPFFAYGCYWASKKILSYQNAYLADLQSIPAEN